MNTINPTIPDKIPGKVDIQSDYGSIHFFRENWGGADWRIRLFDSDWECITTEFACHWCRSPHTIHAISYWLRTLDESVDIIEPIEDIISVTRLSDQDYILVTIGLVSKKITVVLERKKEMSGRDDSQIEVSATINDIQYTFFQRVIDGMNQDNQENPLEIYN